MYFIAYKTLVPLLAMLAREGKSVLQLLCRRVETFAWVLCFVPGFPLGPVRGVLELFLRMTFDPH